MPPEEPRNWHLSRSVPITLLIGLATQGAAIVWTVSMMMADIASNREDLIKVEARVDRIETIVQTQAVSMARIDENIKAIRSSVEQMANNQGK